ncbi:hypothetical protein VNI00_009148 [Paramarasmius palmivorus]|uniref:Calpain catalytic domain-containing protein n=1 Tax=Paramarasmius palmivorus TaxID=297713 RepID=A0AAW0CTN8_9AGAR
MFRSLFYKSSPSFNQSIHTTMALFNLFKHSDTAAPDQASYKQRADTAGLLVTSEFEKALEECKETVARIAKECRAKNRRFRDHEFDLENDRHRCLHGLSTTISYAPSDVRRVTQIFENPQFFVDGADSNDIVQGAIGNCWFVSALATMSTYEGLVEKFCVARDEQIGVYGFIFFRDASWVTIIIDDFLYTNIPKFEELSYAEKQLYHHDKERYNESARKNGKGLYFAKSGTQGETWVPLIEKAYAKLHGCYAALSGGEECEAIEDLTGGVSTFIPTNDIFDTDKFWTEELLKANVDRLFGCAYQTLDGTRSGDYNAQISGLIGNHSYSVLKAVEHNGKRFVIIRNPWGGSEWTGRWSDGSKEWTKEWLDALPELGHVFGDDGQFVMEYKDFLDCWDQIDRTILFDSSWVMSSQWLHVTARPLPCAWTYGDVSFTFTIPKTSPAVIVLSQLDDRFFNEISGRCHWTFDFILYKKGEKDYIAQSSTSRLYARSVNLEVESLVAGEYVVHVRLDRRVYRESGYYQAIAANADQRTLARVLTERAKSQSIASNFHAEAEAPNLPMPIDILAGQDLSELEKKALGIAKAKQAEREAEAKAKEAEEEAKRHKEAEEERKKEETTTTVHHEDGSITTTTTLTEKVIVTVTKKLASGEIIETKEETLLTGAVDAEKEEGGVEEEEEEDPKRDVLPVSEDDSIFLGLRVYTHQSDEPVVISGQLRHEMEVSASLALN